MNPQTPADVIPPRFETAPPLLIAGIGARYKQGGDPGMPSQWQRLAPYLDGGIPGQVGDVTYGVCANFDHDGGLDYIAGVEVTSFADIPNGLTTIRIPERRYAVFTHRGHISAIKATFKAIWSQWLPSSGQKAADAPEFERYDARFNPQTGAGEVEIWLPLEG